MTDPSWLQINLSRLDANLGIIRDILRSGCSNQSDPLFCAVVKADAYGLGAVQIARRLAARGVDMLAVYTPDQAADLLGHSIVLPILMLMPIRQLARTDALYRPAVAGRLHLTIHDVPQLTQVNQIGRTFGCKLPVHLYLDTGMSRSGLSTTQAKKLLSDIGSLTHVRLAGLYTHLATAAEDPGYADEQLTRLDQFLTQHAILIPPDTLIHAANTAATVRHPRFHRSMVRVGLGLLGYLDHNFKTDPSDQLLLADKLKPTVRWVSQINHVQRYPAGTPVGYGCTYRLKRDSFLGIVPIGYANGYPLAMSNTAKVNIIDPSTDQPTTAAVLGRVTMDQIIIDLTPLPSPPASSVSNTPDTPIAQPDAMVELISDDPSSVCALPRLAALAGSPCHELLCRLSPRLKRSYIHTAAKTPGKGSQQPPPLVTTR